MLFNLVDTLTHPDAYLCVWRGGELYIEPAPSAEPAE